jgi:hypothetical protein
LRFSDLFDRHCTANRLSAKLENFKLCVSGAEPLVDQRHYEVRASEKGNYSALRDRQLLFSLLYFSVQIPKSPPAVHPKSQYSGSDSGSGAQCQLLDSRKESRTKPPAVPSRQQ